MADLKSLSVLYVEDEPLARWTGARMLEPLTARLVAVASCGEAESSCARDHFDLIVSDYRLEDGCASDLVRKIRETGCRVPVICLSGEAEDIAGDGVGELFVAILPKPLNTESLIHAVTGIHGMKDLDENPAKADSDTPSPSACARVDRIVPLWVAPEWELICSAPSAPPWFELAPGRKSGVWILLFDAASPCPDESRMPASIGLLFRQIALMLPSAASASRMLQLFRAGINRQLDSDHEWIFAVLRLQGGNLTGARNTDSNGWRVWLRDSTNQWRMLTDWAGIDNPIPVTGCLVMDQASCDMELARRPGTGLMDAGPVVVEAMAGGGGEVPGNCFCLRAQSPLRRIVLRAESIVESATSADILTRMEFSLLQDGVLPLAARRLACGLLGVAEFLAGTGGNPSGNPNEKIIISIDWSGAELSMLAPGTEYAGKLAESGFFDSVEDADGMTHAYIKSADSIQFTDPGFSRSGELPRNPAIGAAADATDLFEVERLPRLLGSDEARAIARRWCNAARLVLNCSDLRYVAPGAVEVWREMAAERRTGKMAAGTFSLLGCTPLMRRLAHLIGLDRDVDLVSDFAELEAAVRRTTSLSERASILESIIKW